MNVNIFALPLDPGFFLRISDEIPSSFLYGLLFNTLKRVPRSLA
jgi:hypothetical protein